jgi:hypothetical protein
LECDFLVEKGRGAVGSGKSSESTITPGDDASDGEEHQDKEESEGESATADIVGDDRRSSVPKLVAGLQERCQRRKEAFERGCQKRTVFGRLKNTLQKIRKKVIQ